MIVAKIWDTTPAKTTLRSLKKSLVDFPFTGCLPLDITNQWKNLPHGFYQLNMPWMQFISNFKHFLIFPHLPPKKSQLIEENYFSRYRATFVLLLCVHIFVYFFMRMCLGVIYSISVWEQENDMFYILLILAINFIGFKFFMDLLRSFYYNVMRWLYENIISVF